MWVVLNDCFLSLVSKDCGRDELLVRARRKGDIEKIFPAAKVRTNAGTDYRFRAVVKKDDVKAALAVEVDRVVYPNFKDSIRDDALHDAYLRVWTALASLQPGLLGRRHRVDDLFGRPPLEVMDLVVGRGKRRRRPRNLKRGQ